MSRWIVIFTVILIGPAGSGTALALSGSGTEGEPWRIQSLADFDEFAGDANYWDGYTRLETDVNLAGRIYSKSVIGSFDGFFDGNDHKVTGLTIDGAAGYNYVGLFASVDDHGIRNLGIEGGSIAATGHSVGALVGYLDSGAVVLNCYSTADVNGESAVGGLVGYLEFYGSIVNCYSTGDVKGQGNVGGLVGYKGTTATISTCFSTGNVTGEERVGGLVGMVFPPMKSRPANNEPDGYDVPLPVKSLEYGISNCYASGDVNGLDYVGGLAGFNGRRVSNCYSTGKVQGTGSNVGGLIGANGRRGTMGCDSGWITNSYWDTQTSGQLAMCGHGSYCANLNCNDSYARTTLQMKQQATFADWDFIDVWAIGEGQTYPYLRTVPASDIDKDGITNFVDFCIIAEELSQEP